MLDLKISVLGIPRELAVPLDGIDTDDMLRHWRWLIDRSCVPMFATLLGDLFLRCRDGRIFFLDVGDATLTPVARNAEHFELLLTDTEKTNYWFGGKLISELRQAGLVAGPGHCYTYWQLPVLGGDYVPKNFKVVDVQTHFHIWGPIHEKIKDLPDGTQVKFVVVNKPEV